MEADAGAHVLTELPLERHRRLVQSGTASRLAFGVKSDPPTRTDLENT